MQEYTRAHPRFALCGLNCGLCPRHHTEGSSRCPGCGGEDFHLKHPSCAVITCSRKHQDVEFCFQCAEYPCKRFRVQKDLDSFVSYRNVPEDMKKAKADLKGYLAELDEKVCILEYLIKSHNDGKRKAFYCLGVNLLPIEDLRDILKQAKALKKKGLDAKERARLIAEMFEDAAKKRKVKLELRK